MLRSDRRVSQPIELTTQVAPVSYAFIDRRPPQFDRSFAFQKLTRLRRSELTATQLEAMRTARAFKSRLICRTNLPARKLLADEMARAIDGE